MKNVIHVFPTLSIGMYDPDTATPICKSIGTDEAREIIKGNTAHLHFKLHSLVVAVSTLLNCEKNTEKVDIDLRPGDTCLIAKYIGPKILDDSLPVPPNRIRFYEVQVFETQALEDMLYGAPADSDN